MEAKKNPQLEIGRNSTLYFAIGLNLMLLFSWRALEHKTYERDEIALEVVNVDEEVEEEIPIVNIKTPPPPPPPALAVIQESIQIVEDEVEVIETVIESTETDQEDAIQDVVSVDEVGVEEVEEEVEVAFAIIENVPVYPGCEGLSRQATKDCFQKKIQQHVVKHFNYPQSALDLGIQGRVSVVFVIGSDGVTTNVRSRGPDKILEKEAERIIRLLPKMKPGKQRGKAVKVAYAVPIFFKYQEG